MAALDALCQFTVLNVLLARSYDPMSTDFAELADDVADVPVDYVYLVGSNHSAIDLLKQLRRAKVQAPVICSPRLEETLEVGDTPELLGETYTTIPFDRGAKPPASRSSWRSIVRIWNGSEG